jgi:hypothetical protein
VYGYVRSMVTGSTSAPCTGVSFMAKFTMATGIYACACQCVIALVGSHTEIEKKRARQYDVRQELIENYQVTNE